LINICFWSETGPQKWRFPHQRVASLPIERHQREVRVATVRNHRLKGEENAFFEPF
jgi:hypothetical protein